jgi:hypothetical protein
MAYGFSPASFSHLSTSFSIAFSPRGYTAARRWSLFPSELEELAADANDLVLDFRQASRSFCFRTARVVYPAQNSLHVNFGEIAVGSVRGEYRN